MKRSRVCLFLLFVLAVPLTLEASASDARPSREHPSYGISLIRLERGCFGCDDTSQLVLLRNGAATLTIVGNARQGAGDKTSRGTFPAHEFDTLAQLVVSQHFFELNDVYENPETQDGRWATIRIGRDGQDKQIFHRDEAGPASLKILETAIDEAKAKIRFGSG